MTIIWCMIPEIWSAADINFCHSGSFFALLLQYGPRKSKFWKNEKNAWRYYHFTNVYHIWQTYDVWFLRYGAWQRKCFVILDCCLLFYPFKYPKNKNFEKMKKMSWNIITLHMCTVNDDHMMYLGPSLAASLEPLAHGQNIARLGLFYRCWTGWTGSTFLFLREVYTHYSDRLHDFCVTISSCYRDVYLNIFFPRTARLWNSLPIEFFCLTYDLNGFKSRTKRHLLTVGSF